MRTLDTAASAEPVPNGGVLEAERDGLQALIMDGRPAQVRIMAQVRLLTLQGLTRGDVWRECCRFVDRITANKWGRMTLDEIRSYAGSTDELTTDQLSAAQDAERQARRTIEASGRVADLFRDLSPQQKSGRELWREIPQDASPDYMPKKMRVNLCELLALRELYKRGTLDRSTIQNVYRSAVQPLVADLASYGNSRQGWNLAWRNAQKDFGELAAWREMPDPSETVSGGWIFLIQEAKDWLTAAWAAQKHRSAIVKEFNEAYASRGARLTEDWLTQLHREARAANPSLPPHRPGGKVHHPVRDYAGELVDALRCGGPSAVWAIVKAKGHEAINGRKTAQATLRRIMTEHMGSDEFDRLWRHTKDYMKTFESRQKKSKNVLQIPERVFIAQNSTKRPYVLAKQWGCSEDIIIYVRAKVGLPNGCPVAQICAACPNVFFADYDGQGGGSGDMCANHGNDKPHMLDAARRVWTATRRLLAFGIVAKRTHIRECMDIRTATNTWFNRYKVSFATLHESLGVLLAVGPLSNELEESVQKWLVKRRS